MVVLPKYKHKYLRMKNILSLLIIIGCLIYASGCKDKKNEKPIGDKVETAKSGKTLIESMNTSMESDSLLAMITNMTKIRPEEVKAMKEDADVIINHRYKETGKKSYIILDKDLWEFEFIFSGKKMSAPNQLAGYWIDFSEDMTYTYGHYQEKKGSGQYTYNLDTGLLLLIDNSENIKPQEYEAKLFDQTLVMDGNDIYKDNNYNAKLKRITERPTK